MEAIVGVVIGLVVGGSAVWLFFGLRAKTSEKLLETAKEELRDTFKAAASDVVANNSQQFLQLANENFGRSMEAAKGQLDQHRQQFEAEVTRLSKFYEKLNPNIESLITRANELTSETGKLSNALTNNRQIGSWGEIQLRRVVELAGMMDHCDFSEQTTVEGSSERPDLTVHLPEQRAVVVDAKASTAAYMEAQQTVDESAADRAMLRHASALRTQVDDLAGKRYGEKVEGSLDFVVMFVPGDQFLAAALQANPTLVEYAMQKRVAIATPASLISLLWAVASGWERHRIAQNAEAIRQAGMEMHRRMGTFIDHYQNVGRRLEQAVDAFNRSVSSYDSRVVPQGRRFAQLVTGDEEDFEDVQAIEKAVNEVKNAESSTPSLPEGG
ncbi:MAG: DNA recombination protein RmuC [Chloroflexota bacterium]|nr:DNA recombination protein RmuC [Chloroflexota bacterium]